MLIVIGSTFSIPAHL